MDQSDDKYEFTFDIGGIIMLKGVIDYAIEKWPGSPARPEMEQDFLFYIRDEVNRCLMEHTFNNINIDSDYDK